MAADFSQHRLDELRQVQRDAKATRARLVHARAEAVKALAAATRRFGKEDDRTTVAHNRYTAQVAALKEARESITRNRRVLQRELSAALPDAPGDETIRLSGEYPIALLPVRLETRFVRGVSPVDEDDPHDDETVGVLRIRVYPDVIATQTHEQRLTEDEATAAQDYWHKAWQDADEAEAWAALLQEMDPPRAAWVVKMLQPINVEADFPASAESEHVPPVFPEPELRPPNWQDFPTSEVLPDRWIAMGYRQSQEVRRSKSRPIEEALALTMTLSNDGEEAELNNITDLSNGLEVDDEVLWTYDFQRALEVGMAIEIPLREEDFAGGFQTLLVVGVKASLTPEQGGDRLSALVDGHHYANGFSFVPQGAPTNNVSEAQSWFPQPDPRGQTSFRVERGEPLVDSENDRDGSRFMRALGVPIEHAAHIWGADRDEQRTARAMAEALWPCTLGYFLEHMMHPEADDDTVKRVRRYFIEQVRARGHYPAFRTGDVPYGLLPVSFIDDWQAVDDPYEIEAQVLPFLTNARNLFQRFQSSAPRINRTDDADRDLLETLGVDASSREAWVRRVLGGDTRWNFLSFSGVDPNRPQETRQVFARNILNALGHAEWDPQVLYSQFSDPPTKFRSGLVVNDPDDPLSEVDSLDFNYIRWLRTAPNLLRIRDQSFPDALEERPTSLCYLMLRHSALQQMTGSIFDILIDHGLALREDRFEREFIGITSESRDTPTVWQRMETVIPGVTAGKPVSSILSMDIKEDVVKPVREINTFRSSLRILEDLPTAELERLFGETMDLCSYRVDGWMTSMVAGRLERMRKTKPLGSHIASYGWVEDLKADVPARGRHQNIDGERVLVRDDSAGYVYAPSMTHGAAAAVLLNGYLTRRGEAKERYAIDLSSTRTREALFIVDAVRNGQPLGAVLGYQFERGLHEGHPGVELDQFIDDFRQVYPIDRNEARDAGVPAETITARNVVDGLALLLASKSEPGFKPIPWDDITLDATKRTAIEEEIALLDRTVDSVADLLLADSVFQVVSGKMDAAGASLKAVGQGARPPEGDIARVPRTGTGVTHRGVLLLGGDPVDISGSWGAVKNERARAEPHLNAWVGRLLGTSQQIKCRVNFGDGSSQMVSLDRLALDPLDLLALAKSIAVDDSDSELDRRVRQAVPVSVATDMSFDIEYALDRLNLPETNFAAMLEVARSINELLGSVRPLQAEDLITPERAEDLGSENPLIAPDLLPVEQTARANATKVRFDAVRGQLRNALNALDLALETDQDLAVAVQTVRDSLKRLALFGVPGAFVLEQSGQVSLEQAATVSEVAHSVLREIDRRAVQFDDAQTAPDKLKGIFGRDFVFLPRFVPARKEELESALANEPSLGPQREDTLMTWQAQVARIRKPLGIWHLLNQYARVNQHTVAASPRLIQLPPQTNDRWVGLPFDDEADRPLRGRVSVMLNRVTSPAADQPWVGLLLDEWMEVIPNTEEDAGVVFHHDSPGAQAPQAILLAVPPTPIKTWDFDLLVKILRQTLLHSKIRGVDRENAEFLYGQLIPMIYLSQNTRDDTVSTHLLEHVVAMNYLFSGT